MSRAPMLHLNSMREIQSYFDILNSLEPPVLFNVSNEFQTVENSRNIEIYTILFNIFQRRNLFGIFLIFLSLRDKLDMPITCNLNSVIKIYKHSDSYRNPIVLLLVIELLLPEVTHGLHIDTTRGLN